MIDPDEALTYLEFVAERHRIWELRQAEAPAPWTDDPVLAGRKFTCVFRVLDYGSQYVLTDLIENDLPPRDLLMRLFLYRHTGRVEAWKHLLVDLGEYPTVANLSDVLESWRSYRGKTKTLKKPPRRPDQVGRGNGFQKTIGERPVFTGAYLVFPQSGVPGTDKLESIIQLTKRLFDSASEQDVMPDFLAAETPAERFATLRRNKGVADFMSMQVLTDWGYSPQAGVDEEDDFVIPGPGARRGAAFLDPQADPRRVIDWAQESVHASPDCPEIRLPGGRSRKPSLMDIQNTLCEYSKYRRHQSRRPPQKPYQPAHPGVASEPVLPEHW